MQTAICMKWGDRYPALYVNRLHAMLMRRTRRPTRLICFTDDAQGLAPAIIAAPLPDVPAPEPFRSAGWRKLSVWAPEFGGLAGEVVFFDIDLVLTGTMDDFWDYAPGSLAIIENWTQAGRGIGNSSVFKFTIGAQRQIWDAFIADPMGVIGAHDNEQIFLSRLARDLVFWPAEWCLSFKHSILPKWPANFWATPKLPKSARVIAFTGKPDPDEARDGFWPAPLHKKLYRHVRPTPWIAEHWRE